jgi:hypothetical protein
MGAFFLRRQNNKRTPKRPMNTTAPPTEPPTMAPKRAFVEAATAVTAVAVGNGVLVEEVLDEVEVVVNLVTMGIEDALGELVANAP